MFVRHMRFPCLLNGVGRMTGLSSKRVDSTVSSFRIHQRRLTFGAQLVPTIRLISPVIAGLFRADAKAFTLATLAGILVWNGLFISVGHVAAGLAPRANASALAIQALALLIAAEVIVGLAWQGLRRRS